MIVTLQRQKEEELKQALHGLITISTLIFISLVKLT